MPHVPFFTRYATFYQFQLGCMRLLIWRRSWHPRPRWKLAPMGSPWQWSWCTPWFLLIWGRVV